MSKYQKYRKYLNSDEWKLKRKHIYFIRNGICEICKKKLLKAYHVHHKTYIRLGCELDSDLMLLCQNCHKELHKLERLKENKKRSKLNFNKVFICNNCLNKINLKSFLNSGKTTCPKCNGKINRKELLSLK